MSLAAVVLAAGSGTRMKSSLAKVLHPLAGLPLLAYPVDLALELKAGPLVVVVGNQADSVRAMLKDRYGTKVTTALQAEQLGTGHAVLCARSALRGFSGTVLILSGDVPLLAKDSLTRLIRARRGKPLALLTSVLDNPEGYGRVLRDAGGKVTEVVEHRDADPEQRKVREANMGIYAVDSGFLFSALRAVGSNNAQGEYYLPDLVRMAANGGGVAAVTVDPAQTRGVNTRVQLAELEADLYARINERHMLAGVSLDDPATTRISVQARIGRDTRIGAGVELRGRVDVGEGCVIDAGSILTDCRLHDDVRVKPYSVIEQSELERGAIIGPFAHLRPGSHIGVNAHVGNFVETKKATLKEGAKANHLSYIGDAVIGRRTNVGAGTITCNYDGYAKYPTTVGDDVLIGSDTQLVAPVTVPDRVVLAAGTSLTGNVAVLPGDLVLTRPAVTCVPGYRDRLEARHKAAKRKKKGSQAKG